MSEVKWSEELLFIYTLLDLCMKYVIFCYIIDNDRLKIKLAIQK